MYFTSVSFVTAFVILFNQLSYLESANWELSTYQNGYQNGVGWNLFNLEGDHVKIDKEEVFLTYSDSTRSCLRGPPLPKVNKNSDIILVTEYEGCELCSKILIAKEAGFIGIILIRNGCMPNEREVELRNMLSPDFNIFITDEDVGIDIKNFAIHDSNQTIRHKVKLRPVVSGNSFRSNWNWNWSCAYESLTYKFLMTMEQCMRLLNGFAYTIFGCSILLIILFWIGYHSIWYIIGWFLLPLLYLLSCVGHNPAVRVRHFLGLRDITWSDSTDGLPSHCSICMDDFYPGQLLVKIRRCGHFEFHKFCLDQWLQTTTAPSCPLCRRRIRESHRGPVEYRRLGQYPFYSAAERSGLSRLHEYFWSSIEDIREWLKNYIHEIFERALAEFHNRFQTHNV